MKNKILFVVGSCIAYPFYWSGLALMFIASLVTAIFSACMDD